MELGALIFLLFWIIVFVVHLNFAVSVGVDGVQRQRMSKVGRGRGTFLVGPITWALAVFITGIVGMGIYWAIHATDWWSDPIPEGESGKLE